MKKPERKYLTAADAAEYIGYTVNTLSQYRSKKIGPSYSKVRGRVLYAVEDLNRWVKSTYVEINLCKAGCGRFTNS